MKRLLGVAFIVFFIVVGNLYADDNCNGQITVYSSLYAPIVVDVRAGGLQGTVLGTNDIEATLKYNSVQFKFNAPANNVQINAKSPTRSADTYKASRTFSLEKCEFEIYKNPIKDSFTMPSINIRVKE